MIRLVLMAALLLCACACAPASKTETVQWQGDFDRLVDHMSAVYANLDWALSERGIDVHSLYEETRADLAGAGNRRSARKRIEEFIRAFDDPHFYAQKGDSRNHGSHGGEQDGLDPSTSAKSALKTMGFRGRNLGFRIDFEKLPGFERISPSEDNPFSWARFTVDAKNIGLLRIAHFGEDGYPDIARPMWPEFAAELQAPCDQMCQWSFRRRVMSRLLDYLAEGAREFSRLGLDAVVIDISGNGGGTDWAAVAPRIFTPPLTECPPLGLARHPHHSQRLDSQLVHLQTLLDKLDLTPASRRTLEAARDSLAGRLHLTELPCDRRPLFRTGDATPECDQLAFGPGCGVLEYLPPGSLADVEDRAEVFSPLGESFTPGVWDGPLFVVMDGNSASASEHFVALLEANDAATLMGETTLGAGCGFIGGGVPIYLEHLDLTVRMPDCARYRANGRNEIDGIDPDIAIPWDGGDGDRAQRIHEALRKSL